MQLSGVDCRHHTGSVVLLDATVSASVHNTFDRLCWHACVTLDAHTQSLLAQGMSCSAVHWQHHHVTYSGATLFIWLVGTPSGLSLVYILVPLHLRPIDCADTSMVQVFAGCALHVLAAYHDQLIAAGCSAIGWRHRM